MHVIDDPQLGPLGPPRPRVCGRCRANFAGDPTLADVGLIGWWACETCRRSLFGDNGLR